VFSCPECPIVDSPSNAKRDSAALQYLRTVCPSDFPCRGIPHIATLKQKGMVCRAHDPLCCSRRSQDLRTPIFENPGDPTRHNPAGARRERSRKSQLPGRALGNTREVLPLSNGKQRVSQGTHPGGVPLRRSWAPEDRAVASATPHRRGPAAAGVPDRVARIDPPLDFPIN